MTSDVDRQRTDPAVSVSSTKVRAAVCTIQTRSRKDRKTIRKYAKSQLFQCLFFPFRAIFIYLIFTV